MNEEVIRDNAEIQRKETIINNQMTIKLITWKK